MRFYYVLIHRQAVAVPEVYGGYDDLDEADDAFLRAFDAPENRGSTVVLVQRTNHRVSLADREPGGAALLGAAR